jgi:hypothetical protein
VSSSYNANGVLPDIGTIDPVNDINPVNSVVIILSLFIYNKDEKLYLINSWKYRYRLLLARYCFSDRNTILTTLSFLGTISSLNLWILYSSIVLQVACKI